VTALRTFRVEVSSSGKVVSCAAVAGPLSEGNRVFYVEATDEAAARDLGRSLYTAYCRDKVRETRARNEANDLCRCGSRRDVPGQKRCSKCIRLEKEQKRRYYARQKGEDVPSPDRFETVSAERERNRVQLRIEVLREVRRKLVALHGDSKALSKWLVEQIDALVARSAA
jgi:hypothetical protein